MTRFFLSLSAGIALVLTANFTHAVDILSQDENAHVVTLTMKDGAVERREVAAKGELRPICQDTGCRIALEDGQFVDAKSEDIVFIDEGKIEIYEP